jgi:phosphoglycolate phosphatase
MYKTLETLKNDNFNLSVATNAQTKFAEKILSCQKIDHFFDFIIGACKVDKPKPEPDMLNLILNLYNYDDKNDYTPIMVGDTHTDIEAGKNAGLKTVFVKWGFGTAIGNEDIVLKEPIELSKIKYLLNYL